MKKIISFSIKALVSLVLLSVLFACSGNSNKKVVEDKPYQYASMQDGVLHLDIDKARKDSTILKLSEVCDSLIYIPLETKKECLLGRHLNDFYIDGDDIFLHMDVSAYHFKTSGKFVGQLGKKGRGPSEYICRALTVNKDDKRIYAKANYKRRMMEFDYNGNLLSDDIKLSPSQEGILYFSPSKSLFYTSSYNFLLEKSKTNEYSLLSEYDLNGKLKIKIKSKYFPNLFFAESKGGRSSIYGASKYIMGNSLRFQEVSSDTVFSMTNGKIKPYIVLNNNDFRKPFTAERFESDPEDKMWWFICRGDSFPSRVCGESSRYIFIDYFSEPSYIYDKHERKLTCVEQYVEYSEGEKPGEKNADRFVYFNDLDGFNHITYTRVVDNKFLLSKIPAIDFLENLEKLKESGSSNSKYISQLEKIAIGLTEESNPVIMLARLKK